MAVQNKPEVKKLKSSLILLSLVLSLPSFILISAFFCSPNLLAMLSVFLCVCVCSTLGPPSNFSLAVGETAVNLSWTTKERHRNIRFQIHYLNKNGKEGPCRDPATRGGSLLIVTVAECTMLACW